MKKQIPSKILEYIAEIFFGSYNEHMKYRNILRINERYI